MFSRRALVLVLAASHAAFASDARYPLVADVRVSVTATGDCVAETAGANWLTDDAADALCSALADFAHGRMVRESDDVWL